MYHQYFGLTEAPFSIAVNPRYLFMSPRHRDALAHLLYGVGAGGGFILLTGEVGTGKTTINRCLLEQLPDDTDIAIILNPALSAIELLASACDELAIDYGADHRSLKTLTDRLHSFLLENHGRGRKTVLLIDEAQHLDFDVLEQIRLLTNLETNSQKLLQIILIGQPELAHMLARPELRQLNQRITARYNLEALNREETGAYIRHRLHIAGLAASRELFPIAVVRDIHRRTRGIPRLINLLCDRTLLGAYGKNATQANKSLLAAAALEVMGKAPAVVPAQRSAFAIAGAGTSVALAILAVAFGWYYLGQSGTPMADREVVKLQPAATLVEAKAPEVLPVAAVAELRADVNPELDNPDAWLMPPLDAWDLLWSLSSQAAPPLELCQVQPAAHLQCSRSRGQTWSELASFNRPLLLNLIDNDRFAVSVILLEIIGRTAALASSKGVREVDLAMLAPLWTGKFAYLWHPPAGFSRPLALGDNEPAVAQVAALFARLDHQSQSLAGNQFNQALDQRVRLFQRANRLDDDGVVGEQTLLKINEQLGIDLTPAAARERLLNDLANLVQR
ncbi:MAG: general secretion pathway protein A [Halieaceae bacterium]|jgi:general secretion pathway protein A